MCRAGRTGRLPKHRMPARIRLNRARAQGAKDPVQESATCAHDSTEPGGGTQGGRRKISCEPPVPIVVYSGGPRQVACIVPRAGFRAGYLAIYFATSYRSVCHQPPRCRAGRSIDPLLRGADRSSSRRLQRELRKVPPNGLRLSTVGLIVRHERRDRRGRIAGRVIRPHGEFTWAAHASGSLSRGCGGSC